MIFLKQATASQSVLIGPFVDSTDGVTAETGLTIANTDIRLSANGGNMAGKNSGGGTHDEAGWYTITLDATDTATVGSLQLSVAVSGALPVFMEFTVLEEAIYDALFAASATGLLPANVTQVSGDSTAADNLEAAYDGTGFDLGGIDVSVLNTAATAIGSDGSGLTEAGGDGDHLTESGGTGDQFTAITNLLPSALVGGRMSSTSHIETGTAQAGADGSITLSAGASSTDDIYNGLYVAILSGTGALQSRLITDYVGSTKVASIEPNWTTNPASGAVYTLIANGSVNLLAATQTTIDGIGSPSDFGSGTSTIAANLEDLADNGTATYDRSTDSLQAIRDRGDAAWTTGAGGSNPFVLQNTTIATLSSQTSFTLTAGSEDDDAYNGMLAIVEDQSTATQKAVGVISDYTGSSKTVTLREDPGIFTMATGDTIDIVAVSPDVLEILADTAEIGTAGAGLTEAGGDGDHLTEAGGDGDHLTEAGGDGDHLTEAGGDGDHLTESGGTGDHLSAVPWNASWDAEVQSEVADALAAYSSEADFAGIDVSELNAVVDDWLNGGRLDLLLDAVKAKTDNLPSGVAKNVALSGFPFLMVDSTDFSTPETGLTVTAEISKDGGSFASMSNSVSEVSAGIYTIDITQAEMNADTIVLKFTATGAAQRTIVLKTDA